MDRETLQGLSSAHRTHRQLRNADSGKNGPPQGRARQLVIQDQIHTNNIIETKHVIFMCL